ncbi:hypothetical protein DdX_17614 [Ditylenchus destructor]|uniref:Uncharacterized protein n=1 Tax=Ditylenchus destructor TaxID=166010 RepID=A0AAD4MM48_9BILA|nr:hypothetical protein DdX_17614 [Ditylenchus destructor]
MCVHLTGKRRMLVTEEDSETVAKPNLEKLSQTMMDLELPLCNSPQNLQKKKVHKKVKQICLRVPTNRLDSLRKQFGQFIISEEQSETSEQSTLEWSSSLSDEEYVRETKSDPEPAMNRMSAVRKSLLASINSKSELPNLSSSDSENEKSTAQKAYRKSKNTKAAAKNIEACTQNFIPKKTQIGSFVFSDSSSDESFVEFRKECQPSKTEYALQCKQSQQEKNTLEGKDTASPKTEEGSNPLNANNGKLLEKMVDPAKPTSEISGSHDEKEADKIEAARWASYWKYWR